MRKLFRMKYETCTGQCYADADVIQIHSFGLDVENAALLLDRLLAMHRPSCGNPQIAFSLDVDDDQSNRPVYVAAMQRYGALDLHIAMTPLDAMNKLIDSAIAWYGSDEGVRLMTATPGDGHDVCHHGDDQALVEFAITRSGLSQLDQQRLRDKFVS